MTFAFGKLLLIIKQTDAVVKLDLKFIVAHKLIAICMVS